MRRKRRTLRLQSAMEYLMTYGWAILIVAIVLGALFALGVFNVSGPRAQPGSCQVYRPYGAGTNVGVSLEGECFNYEPQFVITFTMLNSNDGIASSVPLMNLTQGGYNTVSFWMYAENDLNGKALGMGPAAPSPCADLIFYAGGFGFNTCHDDMYGINPSITLDRWINVVAEFYNGPYTGNNLLYIDGVSQPLSQIAGSAYSENAYTNFYIGAGGGGMYTILGRLADVQLYNVSLSATEIQALYLEGIGGEPVRLQNLVGWWPLNENTNDYSGNSDGGQIVGGIYYTSGWTSGYAAP